MLALALLLGLSPQSSAAASTPSDQAKPTAELVGPPAGPSYRLQLRLALEPAANRGTAQGSMAIAGWPGVGPTVQRCLYLPYNDDNFEFDPIRDFDLVPRKYAKPERRRGHLRVQVHTPGLRVAMLSPHVLRISGELPEPQLRLEFSAQLPRWPDADNDEWLYSDFHPQPLTVCPQQPNDSRTFTFVPDARIEAQLSYDRSWQLTSPGLPAAAPVGEAQDQPVALQLQARKLVIGLVRGFTRTSLRASGIDVEFLVRDPELAKLLPTIKAALAVGTEMYGPLPFPHLVVLETADLEKSSLPGLISINRPRQVGASTLQSDILNWTDWQVTTFIAEQWFGASMTVRNLDDLWLLRGFTDFTTIESLAANPSRYTLLRADSDGEIEHPFDYRATQDLLAAVLTYLHPYNALTGADYVSLEPFSKQHSLTYIRHALALRQINWTIGRDRMRQILRPFFAQYRGKHVAPQDFAAFYAAASDGLKLTSRVSAASHLKQWWTTSEWPDFELLDVVDTEEAGGAQHQIVVTLAQNNGYSLPVKVTVTDDAGRIYTEDAVPTADDPRIWRATLRTQEASDRVVIDETRQILDWDRFNNNDEAPDVNFFPGHARTFADDAYTVLWLPLATKLPGESLTYELVGQAFRYLHNSLTGIVTYEKDTKKVGYSLYDLTDFPKLGSYLVLDAIQDKGVSFRDERLIEAGLYKTLSSIKDPYIEYGLRLRNREVLNHPESRHQTLAFKALVQPLNQYGPCNYSGKLEYETTIHYVIANYNYDRRFITADGSCKVADFLELGGRFFYGDLLRAGDYQGGNIRFDPQDVNEARLRFDEPTLARTEQIWTTGADILLPAYLPIPDDIYVLKRQARYRIFYDFGESEGPHSYYKDAGIGLWLPLGIDLVGKGSVSPLNFSLLLVLYREAGDFKSRSPGILFDFDFIGKI